MALRRPSIQIVNPNGREATRKSFRLCAAVYSLSSTAGHEQLESRGVGIQVGGPPLNGRWTFQVAAINKPLGSVSKLLDDGWRVVFDDEESPYGVQPRLVRDSY